MKIRIKGASVRLRLSRPEVEKITTIGYIEETSPFPSATFAYALERVQEGDQLSANFTNGRITMYVPAALIKDWATNDVISIEAREQGGLHLLLEKDFQCLDRTTEDQSDNYLNPNKNC